MYNSDDDMLKFWVSAKLLILVKIIYVEVLTQDSYSTLGISPTLKFVTTGTNFVVVLIYVATSFSFSNEKKMIVTSWHRYTGHSEWNDYNNIKSNPNSLSRYKIFSNPKIEIGVEAKLPLGGEIFPSSYILRLFSYWTRFALMIVLYISWFSRSIIQAFRVIFLTISWKYLCNVFFFSAYLNNLL